MGSPAAVRPVAGAGRCVHAGHQTERAPVLQERGHRWVGVVAAKGIKDLRAGALIGREALHQQRHLHCFRLDLGAALVQ